MYCIPALWGDGYEKIKVIGQHRGSPHFVVMVVPSVRLTKWRVRLVYSPTVLSRLEAPWSRELAESTVACLLRRDADIDRARRLYTLLDGEPDAQALERAALASIAPWSADDWRARPLGPLPFHLLREWIAARDAELDCAHCIAEVLRKRGRQRRERERRAAAP